MYQVSSGKLLDKSNNLPWVGLVSQNGDIDLSMHGLTIVVALTAPVLQYEHGGWSDIRKPLIQYTQTARYQAGDFSL